MHFEHFPGISGCREGVQNDKQEIKAGQGQAGGPVRAAAVKCGMHCGPICLVPNVHLRPYQK